MAIQKVAQIEKLFEMFLDEDILLWSRRKESVHPIINHILNAPNIDDYFLEKPELNEFTNITSPGVLKRLRCKSGYDLVSKTSSNRSTEVTRKEIRSSLHIRSLIENEILSSNSDDIGCWKFDVLIVSPEYVIRSKSGKIYSIMKYYPFPTLDDVFINGTSSENRIRHLQNIREIFDFLLMKKIIWRDMAPRNILLDTRTLTLRYIVLDFEKTSIESGYDSEIESEFWRGSVLSEEFASSCPLKEVLSVFADKFDPDSWDNESSMPMNPDNMRREVFDIISHRGQVVTVGEYNALDRALVGIREPFCGHDGRWHFPGKLNFIVDHVLGAQYDRMLSEVFLFGQSNGTLFESVRCFEDVLWQQGVSIENFVKSDNPKSRAFDTTELKLSIDRAYETIIANSSIRELLF